MRKEIEDIIRHYFKCVISDVLLHGVKAVEETKGYNPEYVADKILSLFEKKIDSSYNEIEEELNWQIDPLDTDKPLEKTIQDILNIIKSKVKE